MKRSIYILCGLLILLAACEKKVDHPTQGQPIYLSAALSGSAETKVPFVGTAPDESNPLEVAVWASTTDNVFLNTGNNGSDGTVAIHTAASFRDSGPQLLRGVVYPSSQVQGGEAPAVHFVAMHPQDSWNTDDGTKAMFTFNGSQDVMFASRVSGAYDADGQPAANVLELGFEHLLTRITIKMGVELKDGDELTDVLDAWGRIKHLEIQEADQKIRDKVSIDLSKGDGFNFDTDIEFAESSASSLLFYKLGTDEKFPGEQWYELTEAIDSVAYVMCPPVNLGDGAEYQINFETENKGQQSLELDLEKTASQQDGTGSTRGCHYLVTLKFKRGRAITPEVEVIEWENGGYGTGYIED